MRREAADFVCVVLRGYGQLFLCNRAGSGLLFLTGLAIAAPVLAGWSLLAAVWATAGAWLCGARDEADSGLFGVNGALLGISWGMFPEVPIAGQLALTLVGATVVVVLLSPTLHVLRERRWTVTPFALVYLLVLWMNVLIAGQLGWYDPHELRGWHALTAGRPAEAAGQFAAVPETSPQLSAYQHDGWGWAKYQQGQYAQALEHFYVAREQAPELWDAATGVGWAAFQQGDRVTAQAAFHAAVEGDPTQAHAWDGLGWLALGRGDPRAARYFERCLAQYPLLEDAHRGRGYALAVTNPAASAWHTRAADFVHARISPAWQRVSATQWISWALFLAGIAWHSRTSAAVALITLGSCAGLAAGGGEHFRAAGDPLLVYNMLPLTLALGGHYLRVTWRAVVWQFGLAMLLVVSWPAVQSVFLSLGLPLSSLPFHVLLIGTLLALRAMPWSRDLLVPLELATTSPEEVALRHAKHTLAAEAWRRLTPAGSTQEATGGQTLLGSGMPAAVTR